MQTDGQMWRSYQTLFAILRNTLAMSIIYSVFKSGLMIISQLQSKRGSVQLNQRGVVHREEVH
jgi:hypothetical protein